MSKVKSAFFCNNCGYESTKWVGKCPACNEWNTFTEELIDAGKEKELGWDDYNIQQKGSELIAINDQLALDNLTYTEKRRIEYPPVIDYIDAMVKGDQVAIDKYIADCKAVKAKYPKP